MTQMIFLKLLRSAGAGGGIPIRRGTGASRSSLKESGTSGSSTCGHTRGLIKYFKASLNNLYTVEVSNARLQLTTTIDFSSSTATQSQKKSSNLSKENMGELSQTHSVPWKSSEKLK